MKLVASMLAAAALSAALLVSGAGAAENASHVWLCTPANGDMPYLAEAQNVASALKGGSRYATAVFGDKAGQQNNTGTARLTCGKSDSAKPKMTPDGKQYLADNNGWLYTPGAYADAGFVGYPAVTAGS
jgi:hypothetical protein